jgi:hypothetical protein
MRALLVLVLFVFVVSLPFLLIFDRRGNVDELRSTANVVAISRQYSKPFKNTPVIKEYVHETAENPAEVPESLRIFVLNLGKQMQKARGNLGEGVSLFGKLATCAEAGESDELLMVRTVCAENARSLAELYPEQLAVEFQKLSSRLDERVKVLVN